jgi:hypothetical protein
MRYDITSWRRRSLGSFEPGRLAEEEAAAVRALAAEKPASPKAVISSRRRKGDGNKIRIADVLALGDLGFQQRYQFKRRALKTGRLVA